jgi:hypothetical protein
MDEPFDTLEFWGDARWETRTDELGKTHFVARSVDGRLWEYDPDAGYVPYGDDFTEWVRSVRDAARESAETHGTSKV